MPKFYESIPDDLRDWAMNQSLFFTASAPLAGSHVNISPKGLPNSTFRVFSPNTAAYIDVTGSGSETISHVYENGRVTIMFCSFSPSPRILRFFCWGRVIEYDQKGFPGLVSRLLEGRGREMPEGSRAVIWLDVWKVQTSCGFGVPYLSLSTPSTTSTGPPTPPEPSDHAIAAASGSKPESQLAAVAPAPVLLDRDTMGHWAHQKITKNKMEAWHAEWNSYSLDGCPGMRVALRMRGGNVTFALWWARIRRVLVGQLEGVVVGIVLGMMLMMMITMVKKDIGRVMTTIM